MIRLNLNDAFESTAGSLDEVIGALLPLIEGITKVPIKPNSEIGTIKGLPCFLTYYPLDFDRPVFSDATHNDMEYTATFSIDAFSTTVKAATNTLSNLIAYLHDPYARQILRSKGVGIVDTENMSTRSTERLPFNAVQHFGFDLTVNYWRRYTSPIDTISRVESTHKFDKE